MSTTGQAERWRAISSVVVILALSVGGIRQGIAYFNKAKLGSSCFASVGCRSGQCMPMEQSLTGVCTHACKVDEDCFDDFRCDQRFNTCFWRATQRFGQECSHTSQCLAGDCALLRSPTWGEFQGQDVGWHATVCIQACDAQGSCPNGGRCDPEHVCIPDNAVLEIWRRQQRGWDRLRKSGHLAAQTSVASEPPTRSWLRPPGEDLVHDLVVSGLLCGTFAALIALVAYALSGHVRRDLRRLRPGKEDGVDRELLEGVARAEQALIAPMSRRQCVAWEWRFYEGPNVVAVSRGAVPFTINSALGPIHVTLDHFAFPDLSPENSKQRVSPLGAFDSAPPIDRQLIEALQQPEHAAMSNAYALRGDRVHAGYPLIFREYRLDQDASCTVVRPLDPTLAQPSSAQAAQTWIARGVAVRARADQRDNLRQQLRAWQWALLLITLLGPVIMLCVHLVPWLAHGL